MAANKRNKDERLKDANIIAKMRMEGYTYLAITEHLNSINKYSLSLIQVYCDHQKNMKAVIANTRDIVEKERQAQVESTRYVLEQALSSFHDSQKPTIKKKVVRDDKGTSESEESITTAGNPSFLTAAVNSLTNLAKLTGTNAPELIKNIMSATEAIDISEAINLDGASPEFMAELMKRLKDKEEK